MRFIDRAGAISRWSSGDLLASAKACCALVEKRAARIGWAVVPRIFGAGDGTKIALTADNGDGNPTVEGSRSAPAANIGVGAQLNSAAAPHFAQ
jgi:hypothetical protein